MIIVENLEHMEIVSRRKHTPTIKNKLVNILTFFSIVFYSRKEKKVFSNSNILIIQDLKSTYIYIRKEK